MQGAERNTGKEEDIEEEPSDVLECGEDDLEDDIEIVRIGTPD